MWWVLFPSLDQCDFDVVVTALPQHLSLEVYHLVFAAAKQNPHHFIRDLDVAVEQAAEGDVDVAFPVPLAHVTDDEAHLIHFLVNVFLGPVGTLGGFGALFGPPVTRITFVQPCGHGMLVIKVVAEGVELLTFLMLLCELLPPALQVTHGGDPDL